MKTIKLTTLILLATLGTAQLQAQKVYVDVNVGYALPLKGDLGDESSVSNYSSNDQTGASSYSTTYTSVNSSLGKGLNFGGSVGYMFNENLGFELGLNYIIGSEFKIEDIENNSYTDITGTTYNTTDKYTYSISSNMFQIAPTLVLSTGFDKFTPYAKMGFVMGFGKIISEQEYTSTNYGTSNFNSESSGGMGLGFSGSIGAQYALNERISLFSEMKFMSFSYAPKKSITTEYTQDGIDQLPGMTTSQKETEFLKEYTEDSTINDNEPSKTTKFYAPYNNIGLNFGVKFSF